MKIYIKYILLLVAIGIISFTILKVSGNYLEAVKVEYICDKKANWRYVPYTGTYGYGAINSCTGDVKQGYMGLIERKHEERVNRNDKKELLKKDGETI